MYDDPVVPLDEQTAAGTAISRRTPLWSLALSGAVVATTAEPARSALDLPLVVSNQLVASDSPGSDDRSEARHVIADAHRDAVCQHVRRRGRLLLGRVAAVQAATAARSAPRSRAERRRCLAERRRFLLVRTWDSP